MIKALWVGKDSSSLRSIAARRSGLRCAYCGCPTAAEIEHVHARTHGGASKMDNLVLSCPWCNKKKGKRDVQEFIDSGDWRLARPELESTLKEMLARRFGWTEGTGGVLTSSMHSRLEVLPDRVNLMVRPGKRFDWTRIALGSPDEPWVIGAAWDFLARHFTPASPRTASENAPGRPKPRPTGAGGVPVRRRRTRKRPGRAAGPQ